MSTWDKKESIIRWDRFLYIIKNGLFFIEKRIHDDEIGMPAHIDSKEHTEILKRYNFIIEKFHKYIDAFIEGLKQEPLQPKYKLSSLTFYKELLLSSSI